MYDMFSKHNTRGTVRFCKIPLDNGKVMMVVENIRIKGAAGGAESAAAVAAAPVVASGLTVS